MDPLRAVLAGMAWACGCDASSPQPCEELSASACQEDADCIWTEVKRYRDDENGCTLVETTPTCLERMHVSAGCAGHVCGGTPGDWYRTDTDNEISIAPTDLCGDGIAGWRECQSGDQGAVPPACDCV